MPAHRFGSILLFALLAIGSVACGPVPCNRLYEANLAVEKVGGDCWGDPPVKSADQLDTCNQEAARACSAVDLQQLDLVEACVAKLDICEGNALSKAGWVFDVLSECVNKPLGEMSADCRQTVQGITQQ